MCLLNLAIMRLLAKIAQISSCNYSSFRVYQKLSQIMSRIQKMKINANAETNAIYHNTCHTRKAVFNYCSMNCNKYKW